MRTSAEPLAIVGGGLAGFPAHVTPRHIGVRDVMVFASERDPAVRYPENLVGQVHADGRIWSRALWDIRNVIGHVKADTVILEGSSTSRHDDD